jgi:competence protein ComEA
MTAIDRITTLAALGALLTIPAPGALAQSAAKPAAAPASAAQAKPAAAAPAVSVELNSATLQDLTQLPGVGPSRAQAILDLRTRMGGFKKVEDIMRVKGIGRKTFRKLEPMLRLQASSGAHPTAR